MGHAAPVIQSADVEQSVHVERRSPILFQSLVITERQGHGGRAGLTVFISLLLHSMLIVSVAVLPLLFYDALPGQDAIKAFFVSPLELAPPPPPPPPPPPSARAIVKTPRVETLAPQAFVAPIEVPAEIAPEAGLDLGIEGGAEGGVEGGVPGGVVGGIVGGLPTVVPPPPARVVRIGGRLLPPKVVRRVEPVYPELAVQARISAILILEAEVDEHGRVRTVKVVRGHPLLDEAAMVAVRQWRYQPLLLNGEPTAFILTVTVAFNLRAAG